MRIYSQKQTIQIIQLWAEAHKKGILIGMVSVLFVSLLIRIAGLFFEKTKDENAFRKLKITTEKVGKTTKTGFNQAVDVNEMYKKANEIMQKDSLTKEDYDYIKMVDSTFKSMTR